MGGATNMIPTVRQMKGNPMRRSVVLLTVLCLGLGAGLLTPKAALAWPTKFSSCTSCHSTQDANAAVTTFINGTAGTTITVAPGATFEVDYYFTNATNAAGGYGIGVEAALPSGWGIAAGTSNYAPGGWNAAWDNADGVGSWGTLFDASGEYPLSPDAYTINYDTSGWDTGNRNTAFDDGSAGDLDGTSETMGADLRITVPGGTADGTYEVVVEGIGHDGSTKTHVEAVLTITVASGPVDSTPPTANNDVAVAPESGTYVPAAFTVTGTFSDPESAVSGCEYTLDGAAWSPGVVSGSGPYTCTANVSGQADAAALTINLRATSAGGGPTASTAINRTVDAAAPTTSDNVPAGWQTADVTVTLTPADAGSGVASTSYCVDTANSCAPGTPYAAPFLVSGEGTNYVRYSSTDNLGNLQTVVSTTLQLDKTAPTDGTLTPAPGNTQIALSWSAATDAASGLTSPAYKLVMASGTTTPPADCSGAALFTGDALNYTATGLTNGVDYAFRLCATDAAGWVSAGATATAQPLAGNTAPNVPASPAQYESDGTTVVAVGGYATTTTLVFEADLSDPDGDTVKLQIDYTGDSTSDCESALVASGSTNVQVSCPGLSDGSGYDWQYRAVDSNAAGSAWTAFNAASPDFTIDTTAPVDGSLTPTAGDTQIVLTWTAASDVTSGLASPAYKLVMASGTTTPPPDCSGAAIYTGDALTHTETGLVNGTDYAFRVCATNNAGLVSAGATGTTQPAAAPNSAPTVVGALAQYEDDGTTPLTGGGNAASNAVVVAAQVNDVDGDLVVIEVDIDSDSNVDCVSSTVSGSGTPQALCSALADGAYDWQVRAKDSFGNTSGWTVMTGSPDFNIVAGVDIGIDTTPPSESGFAAVPGDTIIDLSWNVADDGSGSGLDPVNTYKLVRATGAAPADCSGAAIYQGNLNAFNDTGLANGTTYYYRVCAYDNLGNVSSGQTTSATPGSACTENAPNVSLIGADKDITLDGGFVDYTVSVTNTDVGACAAVNFDLVVVDSNGSNFYPTTIATDPLNVVGGGTSQTTIRVTAQPNQGNGNSNATYVYTAAVGGHAQSANSNTVTTTINVSAGGCEAQGDYLLSNGDRLTTSR